MYTTGIRDLRGSLAEAVRRAGAGQRTVITAHGRPVAQLAPLDDAAPDIDRLVSAGSLDDTTRPSASSSRIVPELICSR